MLKHHCVFVCLLTLLIIALVTGCGGSKASSLNEIDYNDGKEDVEPMDVTTMSDREKEILGRVYADKKQITEGKLFSHQKEALRQLRAGLDYLERKYPGYEFNILSFAPANKFTPWAVFQFQNQPSEECVMTITPQNGDFVCADNYYSVLLREKYDDELQKILAHNGFEVVTYTLFPTPMGEEIGENTSTDTLISMGTSLTRNTNLYLFANQESETTAQALQAALSANGIYGFYSLYFVSESRKDVAFLEEHRTQWPRISFHVD